MPTTWSGGAELSFSTEGEGEHVLLIGDLTADREAWRAQVEALRGSYRVTTYDARGSGRSAAAPGSTSIDQLARDAVAVLDAGDGTTAHLVGAGLGGVTAHHVAQQHPSRVASLTLSGTWLRSDRRQRAILTSWAGAAQHAASVRELLSAIDPWLYGPALWRDGTIDRRHDAAEVLHAEHRYGGWGGQRDAFLAKLWALADADERANLIATDDVPTLIINGELDPLVSARDAADLAAAYTGARVEIIEGVGHHPAEEDPATFNRRLIEFLSSAVETLEPARRGA
ncbi:MAG: alpha/beta fold hydrolase [Solirubrobacteraceae bacterium]